MNKEIIIALCAGEASGDLLGAHLIQALKQQYPRSRFIGIGGPRMKAAGLSSLYEQDPLAVRGYVEVLGNLREILRIRREFIHELKQTSPHVFIGIDAPNFNLPVAEKLKAAGIPTLQYVSPSIWAWKPERVHKIVKQVNQVLCLFPMEPKLYRDAGGRAEFVGHPLAQILPMENNKIAVRERLKLGLTTPVFTLLPGSRISEVEFMAPVFLRAAALIVQSLPEAVFLMPYPSAPIRERLQGYLQREEFRHLPIRLQAAKTELACMAADVVLVTSGTATLEVALCKRPMVISYKISAFTYWLVRRKIKIPYVGLPNILLGKEVVPELLQDNATPEKLAHAVLDWYYHPVRVEELERQFEQLHQRLLRNTDELAAYAVLSEAGVQLPKPEIIGADEEEQLPNTQKSDAVNDDASDAQAVSTDVEVKTETVVEENVESPPAEVKEEKFEAVEVDSTQINTTVLPEPVPSNTPIPKPEVIMTHHHRVTPAHPAVVITPSSDEPNPAPIEPTPMNMQSQSNKNQSKTMRKSGGLFGWIKSLFGGRQDDEHPVQAVPDEKKPTTPAETVASEINDVTIVAVSRAESDEEKSPSAPSVAQPMAVTNHHVHTATVAQTAQVANPSIVVNTATPTVRHVIEEEELAVAPVGIAMPKSTILAQSNKPNIFTKYQTQDGQAPVAETSEPAPATIKITATVQKPTEEPSQNTASPANQVKTPRIQVSSPVIRINPTATAETSTQNAIPEPSTETSPAHKAEPAPQTISSLPTGTLAGYINRASMAWLPDSVKAPSKSTITKENTLSEAVNTPTAQEMTHLKTEFAPVIENNDEISLEVVSTPTLAEDISLEIVSQPEPTVSETVASTTKIDEEISLTVESYATPSESIDLDITNIATVAPSIPVSTESVTAETDTVSIEVSDTPTESIEIPSVSTESVASEPAMVETAVETTDAPKIPTITIAHSPVLAITEEDNSIVIETPVAEPEAETVAPAVIEIPQPKTVPAQPSFANVFRRHTLSNDGADAEDDKAENEHNEVETEAPAQIVVERTVEMMAQEPTQVSNTKDMAEEATEAPSVPRYSANPKRYNNGIFY